MSFNSLLFVFLFLPVSVILSFVCKNNNLFIVLISFLFYAWGNPISLVLLILYILLNYFTALSFEKAEGKQRKITLIIAIVVQVAVLFIYKYLDFFLPFIKVELHAPIGLSFFTFSCLSYLLDVYFGKCNAQHNLIRLALYVSFFGKVTMGPIVQYNEMVDQIDNHPFQIDLFCDGIKKLCIGLTKKVILADSLSLVHMNLMESQSVLGSWLLAITYMLQIYFDFSGYSDMAIGIGEMFGFKFKQNFNYPYIATSIQDFWRRWHISLSLWFRDYIYIPLGGSREGNNKYIRNIFVVWLLTGLWHGANWTFIVWGLYFAVLLLFEKFVLKKFWDKVPKFICHIYTLFLVLISWIFFMSDSLSSAFQCILHMFGMQASLLDSVALFNLKSSFILLVISILFCLPIRDKIESFICSKWKQKGMIGLVVVYLVVFLVSVSFMISRSFHSFLYFAF